MNMMAGSPHDLRGEPYRQAFMAPAPGPNEAESKAIADQIVATSLLNK